MSLTTLDTQKELKLASKLLTKHEVFDEQGHISARDPEDPNKIWINKQTSPKTASLKDFVTVDIDFETLPDGIPTEVVIHTELFRARDDVQAVCHNHAPYTTAVASVGLEMKPVHHVGVLQKEPISVYEDYDLKGGTLIQTKSEGRELAELMGDDRALALRGHGANVVGGSIAETALSSLRLEYNSRMLWQQAAVGEPWYLPDELLDYLVELRYENIENGLGKSLNYYLETLE